MYELFIVVALLVGIIVSIIVGGNAVCFVVGCYAITRVMRRIETIEEIANKNISIEIDSKIPGGSVEPYHLTPDIGHLKNIVSSAIIDWGRKAYDYPLSRYVICINPWWALSFIMENKDLRVRDLCSICVIMIEHEIGHILSNTVIHGDLTYKETVHNEIMAWKHGAGCTGVYYDKEVYKKVRKYFQSIYMTKGMIDKNTLDILFRRNK